MPEQEAYKCKMTIKVSRPVAFTATVSADSEDDVIKIISAILDKVNGKDSGNGSKQGKTEEKTA